MKLGLTAKALALAVAVGITSQAMADTTTGWWDINFENVTAIAQLTNETANVPFPDGTWTISDGDESTITNAVPADEYGTYLKLDTQGTDLVWKPNAASTEDIVLVNADIFLVGSDSEPTGFDTDTENPVQSAVYLKNYLNDDNEPTNSVLCAYVSGGSEGNKWVELSADDVTMVDTNWYKIKIEVDYTGTTPEARFYVDNKQMVTTEQESFPIANYNKFSTDDLKKVNSVSFRGTGAVDNFVGQQVTPTPAAELQFTVATYTDEVQDIAANVAAVSDLILNAGTQFYVVFEKFDSTNGTEPLSLVRVYTSGSPVTNDYVVSFDGDTTWTYGGPLFYDDDNWGIRLNIETVGMTEGQIVEAYYGTHPPIVEPPAGDPSAPAIGGGDIGTNAPVSFETVGSDEYFCVTFAAPEAGVTYSLETATALGEAFIPGVGDDVSGTSASIGQVITLKAKTGGATKMFFRVKAEIQPVAQ